MYQYLTRFPVFPPVLMTLVNVASFATGLVFEGRIKEGAATFTLRYASTIPAAARGDLNPFFAVLCQPG